MKSNHKISNFQKCFFQKGETKDSESLYKMTNSKDQIMSSHILDKPMDQEMVPGPCGSFESQNSIEECDHQLCKSTIKVVPK